MSAPQVDAQIPSVVSKCFDVSAYDEDLGYLGPVDAAIGRLQVLQPDAVVAGSEWGVTFAEFVAHGLGLPTNRIETISARRNKFDMIEAVHAHGLLRPIRHRSRRYRKRTRGQSGTENGRSWSNRC